MKRGTLFIIVGLIIASLLIPFSREKISDATYYLSEPIMDLVSGASMRSKGFFSGIADFYHISDENRKLTEKLRQYQVDSTRLRELEVENESLKKQIGFLEENDNVELVPARIIGREPTSYLDYIIIDRGSKDGVSINQGVVSEGALVGQVCEVHEGRAKVTLITSKDSIVQAMLSDSREFGTLRGGLSGLSLENIPQDVIVENLEMVVTSGLSGEIKQGIPIGEVYRERPAKAEIFKILDVDPLVDFSKLENVFVIK